MRPITNDKQWWAPVWKGLVMDAEATHYRKMKSAVWLYLYCLLAGTVARELYERSAKAYREKRQQAETRLAQLDVEYADPLEFLDQCSRVAGMLAHLHHKFTFEQRKNLLRAVFKRIDEVAG